MPDTGGAHLPRQAPRVCTGSSECAVAAPTTASNTAPPAPAPAAPTRRASNVRPASETGRPGCGSSTVYASPPDVVASRMLSAVLLGVSGPTPGHKSTLCTGVFAAKVTTAHANGFNPGGAPAGGASTEKDAAAPLNRDFNPAPAADSAAFASPLAAAAARAAAVKETRPASPATTTPFSSPENTRPVSGSTAMHVMGALWCAACSARGAPRFRSSSATAPPAPPTAATWRPEGRVASATQVSGCPDGSTRGSTRSRRSTLSGLPASFPRSIRSSSVNDPSSPPTTTNTPSAARQVKMGLAAAVEGPGGGHAWSR